MIWFCMSFYQAFIIKDSITMFTIKSFIHLFMFSKWISTKLSRTHHTWNPCQWNVAQDYYYTKGDNCGREISLSSRVSNTSSPRLRILFLIFHHILKLVNVCQSGLYSSITKSSHLRCLRTQLYSQSMLFEFQPIYCLLVIFDSIMFLCEFIIWQFKKQVINIQVLH